MKTAMGYVRPGMHRHAPAFHWFCACCHSPRHQHAMRLATCHYFMANACARLAEQNNAPQTHCVRQDGPAVALAAVPLDALVQELHALALVRTQVAADEPAACMQLPVHGEWQFES